MGESEDTAAGEVGPIRVLIVDGTWWWREAAMRVLERHPRFEAEVVDDPDSALRRLDEFGPNVVVVDLGVEGGEALLDELRKREIPAVAWGDALTDERVVTALSAGASYVLKTDLDPQQLCHLLVIVASGDTLLPQATRRLLSDMIRRGGPVAERKYDLTPREAEVLELIGKGKTNAEIAEALHLAPSSVKKLVSRVMQRLGVRNRTEAALLAQLDSAERETALAG